MSISLIRASSGGSGTAIGSPITGGTDNEVLYIDGSGNLAQSSFLSFNGTNLGVGVSAPVGLERLTISEDNTNQKGIFLTVPGSTGSGGQINWNENNDELDLIADNILISGIFFTALNTFDDGSGNMTINGDLTAAASLDGFGIFSWQGYPGAFTGASGDGVSMSGGQGFNVASGTTGIGAGGNFGFSSGAGGVISGSSSGTITGGNGGFTTITGGTAGQSTQLGSGTGKGGVGGTVQITTGNGGVGIASGTGSKGQGGAGGGIALTAASGGSAATTTTSNNTGGAGGAIVVTSGAGSSGANGGGTNRGGNGGQNSVVGGRGGDATGGTSATGGNGSTITFAAGQGGSGSGASVTNTNGNGGSVTFRAGPAGGAGTGGSDGSLQFTDAAFTNIIQITTGKLGFYATTPIVQPTSTTDLRTALINLGLYASGGATPLNLNGGNLTSNHVIGSSSTPGIAAGAGAGTTPTVSVTGTDIGGLVTVTTGTLPTGTNAVVATITYAASYSYPNGSYVVLYPANAITATLSGVSMVYATGTTITFVITSGTTALTAATTYLWNYHVIGN